MNIIKFKESYAEANQPITPAQFIEEATLGEMRELRDATSGIAYGGSVLVRRDNFGDQKFEVAIVDMHLVKRSGEELYEKLGALEWYVALNNEIKRREAE